MRKSFGKTLLVFGMMLLASFTMSAELVTVDRHLMGEESINQDQKLIEVCDYVNVDLQVMNADELGGSINFTEVEISPGDNAMLATSFGEKTIECKCLLNMSTCVIRDKTNAKGQKQKAIRVYQKKNGTERYAEFHDKPNTYKKIPEFVKLNNNVEKRIRGITTIL